jgi:hypothetical protein
MNHTNHTTFGRYSLGDLSDATLNGYAQQIVASPPGQGAITAVNLFQQSYNANGGSPQIQVDGEYGPCTAYALQTVLDANGGGTAPNSAYPGTCVNGLYVAPGGGTPSPAPGGGVSPAPGGGGAITPSSSSSSATVTYAGIPVWAWWLFGGIAVLGLGVAVFHKKGPLHKPARRAVRKVRAKRRLRRIRRGRRGRR